jgi:hypothetical protein
VVFSSRVPKGKKEKEAHHQPTCIASSRRPSTPLTPVTE